VMFPVLFAAGIWHYVFGILLFLLSLFLILLVLVQRGRGGGLTGALGGMGGQSAFGAKAGDTFTRVTMVTATVWIVTCMAAIKLLGTDDRFGAGAPTAPGANVIAPGVGDVTTPDALDAGAGGVLDDSTAEPGPRVGLDVLRGDDSSPPED
jgi:preprotein translocase subunit SecG